MKIICIGRNYGAHIDELQNQRPEEPVVFIKPDSAILLKQYPFVIPEFSNDLQHELEVVVKINKVGKYIDAKFAHKYYEELTVGIDFTARDLQNQLKAKGLPWEKAKSFDGSAVVGEFVSKETLGDLKNLSFSMTKNGEIVQSGNTKEMIWNIDEIIAYVSQYFTLKIGDLIYTGTPAGVSAVKENDLLEGYIGENKLFRIQVK